MKTSLLLAAIVPAILGHALDPRATACKNQGNNCQRGVSGANGKPALDVRLADCASYLATTVTPEASTTTVTETTTTYTATITSHTGITTTSSAPLKRSTGPPVAGNAKPTYATYCAGDAAYSSACLCAGVTPATTTLPTPTVTATSTEVVATCLVEYVFRKRGWNGAADFVDWAFH